MELTIEVIGMKCFKGRVNGSDIDSGSVYGVVKLDERYNKKDQESTNWKFGHSVEEWKLPGADHVMRLGHLKPSLSNPVPMKLEIERVSTGRETKEVVLGISPVHGSTIDQNTGEIQPVRPAPAPVAPVRKAA